MPSVVLIGRDFGCFFSPSLLHFPRLYRYAQGASGQTQSFAYPIVKIRDFVLLFFSPKEEGGRITKERKKERKKGKNGGGGGRGQGVHPAGGRFTYRRSGSWSGPDVFFSSSSSSGLG